MIKIQKGLEKKILLASNGATPKDNQQVFVNYIGLLESGEVFDSCTNLNVFQFNLGSKKVIPGWELGVSTMKKGEKAILYCQPEYAYGIEGYPPKIPKNEILTFEIELLDFRDPPKDKWDYNEEELTEYVNKLNLDAKSYVEKKYIGYASFLYKEAVSYAEFKTTKDRDNLIAKSCCNYAFCLLKQGKNTECVIYANKTLKYEPNNEKALYRLGMALLNQGMYDKALNCFKKLKSKDLQEKCINKTTFWIKNKKIFIPEKNSIEVKHIKAKKKSKTNWQIYMALIVLIMAFIYFYI